MSLCMSYFVALSCANQFAGVDGSALSIVAALLFFVGRCASDPVFVSSGVPSLGPWNQSHCHVNPLARGPIDPVGPFPLSR